MKKLFTTLLLSFLFLATNAQNLIGNSIRDVYKTLDEKGFIINKGYTDDNIYYMTATDNESIRIYYFSKNNICAAYAISYKGYSYSDVKLILNKAGYWQTGDAFYTNDYKATVSYMSDYGGYLILILTRN